MCLFSQQTALRSVENLKFEAQTIESNNSFVYGSMFSSCTNLLYAPKILSAQNLLGGYCYGSMFENCTSLITAPKLPATTLANYCYQYMFRGCTSLVNVPELPATTLRGGCYLYMFEGCKKLNTIRCKAKVTATDATYL